MNEQALTVIEPAGQLVARSPMDALALMSENEFEDRLKSLKVAQQRMARIQREIMTPDVDYGVIPGTGTKPTLLKPGAETLCKFHHLVPTFERETILGDGVRTPHIRVLMTCSLHYETEDGPIVAQGMGAANSWEKKHRWREGQRKCPACGATAIIKGKAEFGGGFICWAKKGGCGSKYAEGDPDIINQQQGQIENPDPFDAENTLVKIAAKRAQTDATLRATATSGLFTQDVEDLADAEGNQPPARAPQQAAPPKTNGKTEAPKAKAEQGPPEVVPPPYAEPRPANQDNLPGIAPADRITPQQLTAIYAAARKLGIATLDLEADISDKFQCLPKQLSAAQANSYIDQLNSQ